ncbi:MAG: hypothetical protein EA427_07490 [Spirochaetaceae bacterium]|nr:MAG: hypothetical protein EA427_07490 [Spirochaetaceae bacterium]
MQYRKPEGPAVEAVLGALNSRGYSLVTFSAEIVRKQMHVHCVVTHGDGVNLDTLAEIHREVQPEIEDVLAPEDTARDIRIEFSSPGLSRVFGSFHEFEVFLGREVEVLPVDSSEWLRGKIIAADDAQCLLRRPDGTERTFQRESLVKARLTE